jgi:transcriptional regulator with XRE-family HTH domain
MTEQNSGPVLTPLDRRVGLRFQLARTRAGLSEQDAAALVGVSLQAYLALEAGETRASPMNIANAAQAFGQDITELLPWLGRRDEGERPRLDDLLTLEALRATVLGKVVQITDEGVLRSLAQWLDAHAAQAGLSPSSD